MRSHEDGSLSAAMQVKVSSPEILHFTLGQGFHILETSTEVRDKGEVCFSVSGSKSVADKRIDFIGTWENRRVSEESFQGAEEATREYCFSVVGLTHSRGVNRVMPVESWKGETLEGVSSLTQGGDEYHAIH